MKALKRPVNENNKNVQEMKKRILINVDKITEAKAMIATARIVAFCCVAMSKNYGFGKKRIKEFYKTLLSEVKRQHQDMTDTGDDMLYMQLRSLGLDDLVKDIENAQDYYKTMIDSGFFEGSDQA